VELSQSNSANYDRKFGSSNLWPTPKPEPHIEPYIESYTAPARSATSHKIDTKPLSPQPPIICTPSSSPGINNIPPMLSLPANKQVIEEVQETLYKAVTLMAPQDISSQINDSHIIKGRQQHKPKKDNNYKYTKSYRQQGHQAVIAAYASYNPLGIIQYIFMAVTLQKPII
jgi:hypothetical protein